MFRNQKGAAELIEAALTIPLVVLLTVAIVNLGLAVYASQMAEEAARYGVRVASVSQDNPAGRGAAAAYQFATEVLPGLGSPQVTVLAPGGVAGATIRIRVTYRVPNFLGGLAGLFPGLPRDDFVVVGEATARQEGW